jgi:putative membrane protein
MKALTLIISLLVLSVAGAAGAGAASALSSADTDFVKSVQQDALGQYAIGSLAQNKAHDPRVKALAKTVAANAASANDTLKKVASSHGIMPENKPTMRASYQYSNLSEASGPAFDQAFAGQIRIDASIAADACADYAAHGSNPQLRSFAKAQAATLKAIAAQAERLR